MAWIFCRFLKSLSFHQWISNWIKCICVWCSTNSYQIRCTFLSNVAYFTVKKGPSMHKHVIWLLMGRNTKLAAIIANFLNVVEFAIDDYFIYYINTYNCYLSEHWTASFETHRSRQQTLKVSACDLNQYVSF